MYQGLNNSANACDIIEVEGAGSPLSQYDWPQPGVLCANLCLPNNAPPIGYEELATATDRLMRLVAECNFVLLAARGRIEGGAFRDYVKRVCCFGKLRQNCSKLLEIIAQIRD
ncbi:MAG: hypothetical protein U0805_04910 [Pirellulales bacterium]